jgi:hypothetical protein
MYGDFFLLERPDASITRATKLPLGDTSRRNEAWLRDRLFEHPEVLPISDIDASFGPLIPLCRELRTEAGPVDVAFINPTGHLTLVECKLWRNAEARRKVVAQVLDYARCITRWSYSDLRRQVAIAKGEQGDLPFDLVRRGEPGLTEHHFADAVARAMRSGRFLLLIAGDGARYRSTGRSKLPPLWTEGQRQLKSSVKPHLRHPLGEAVIAVRPVGPGATMEVGIDLSNRVQEEILLRP